jgi:thiamine-phosphate pyrophosphorylase
MLVTDATRLRGRVLTDVVTAAVEGGVNVVQLREKSLPHDQLTRLATDLREAIAGRALLFVNSDVDAAIVSGAEGVHLPHDGPPIADVRARVGASMLISRAVHSIDEAIAAGLEGADLLVLGSVFPSPSHPGASAIGVQALRAVCARVAVPVIAIGGITPATGASVMRAGASGVAVIGAILDAGDPAVAAAALSAAIAVTSPA